jgi:hypothetical protein
VSAISERPAGWRQGPDGRWYPPLTGSAGPDGSPSDHADLPLAELAELINSGEVTASIDALVDDPELSV